MTCHTIARSVARGTIMISVFIATIALAVATTSSVVSAQEQPQDTLERAILERGEVVSEAQIRFFEENVLLPEAAASLDRQTRSVCDSTADIFLPDPYGEGQLVP